MEEIDLKELFNIFWSKKIQIFLVVLIFTVIGAVYSYGLKTPKYTASTTLVLAMSDSKEKDKDAENSITTTDITLNSKLVPTYSELVRSKSTVKKVIDNLGIDENLEVLRNSIKVTAVEETEVIRIAVTHVSPSIAEKVANEIAKVFSEKIQEIYKINNITTVDEAEVPNGPSNIHHTKDVILFSMIGLVISAAYVFVLNMIDNTVKSTEDIEKVYNMPVLVTIPLIENFNNERGGNK